MMRFGKQRPPPEEEESLIEETENVDSRGTELPRQVVL